MQFLTVLPAFFGGEQGIALSTAKDIITQSLAAVLDVVEPHTCLALSNSADLADLFAERGIHCALTSEAARAELFCLPTDLRQETTDFAARLGEDCGAVFFVNPFNPLLPPASLRQAMQTFLHHPSRMLVSVRDCRDHPCQFQRLLRLADLDVIHLLDPAKPDPASCAVQAEGACAVSLPFGSHRMEKHLFRSRYATHSPSHNGRVQAWDADAQTMIFDGESTMRLSVRLDQEITGLPAARGEASGSFRLTGFFGHLRRHAALFERCADGTRHLFFRPGFPHQEGCLLRLIPFTANATCWDQTQDILVTRLNTPYLLNKNSAQDICGYIVCVLTFSANGEYDFSESFSPLGAPWCVRNGKLYNLEGRRYIHGRQAFPAIVEPDGSLCIVPLHMLRQQTLDINNAWAFRLAEDKSHVVSSQADYLRMLSKQQARKIT